MTYRDPAAIWCEVDDCPAVLCNGPHREEDTTLGVEIVRLDQPKIGQPAPGPDVPRETPDAEPPDGWSVPPETPAAPHTRPAGS